MEYVIGVVILAVAVYMLTRKKKEKPPIEPPIEKQKEEQKEDKKEVIVPTEQKVYWIKDGKKEWGRMKYMPQGLQVFDEHGNCTLDINARIGKVLGHKVLDTAEGTLFVSGGRPWFVTVDTPEAYGTIRERGDRMYQPKIYIEGNSIKWEQVVSKRGEIIYGVY